MMTALTRSSSARAAPLPSAVPSLPEMSSLCLPTLLFTLLFVLCSLQREEMHEEREADRKGMGRGCSPSLNGSQELTAGTACSPSLRRELCWAGHRLQLSGRCRGGSQEELAPSAERAALPQLLLQVLGALGLAAVLPQAGLCSFMDSAYRTVGLSVISSLVRTGFVN